MKEAHLTDATPEKIAQTALEYFRDGGSATITTPLGSSYRSHHPREHEAPYEIADADDGVELVPVDGGKHIPVRDGSMLTARRY